MRRMFLALMLIVAATAACHAAEHRGLSPLLVAFKATPPAAASMITTVGRACDACRRSCVRDYKIDCYESERWCRRQFTLCMRECWYDYCR